MFFFRLNRILIHSNFRHTIFKRRDKTDVEIYCFVTTGDRPLPSLKGLTAATDDALKTEMLKRAVRDAIDARIFTPVENVKDEQMLTFGDTGFVIYEAEKIPDDFNFQLVLIGSRKKQRDSAKMWEGVLQDSEFAGFLQSTSKLLNLATNPVLAAGSEIGKYLASFILRVYAEQHDDQLGLVYQSLNRMEHYPHGERKRDGNKDLTGNMEFDYSLFGFEKQKKPKKDNVVG